MKNDSFVYIWINLTDNKKYIGYHKGDKDDGYVSSSANPQFWKDFKNKSIEWERKIIFEGNQCECLKEEQRILKDIDINSDQWYNNARGKDIIWTDDVRRKASNSHKLRWKNMSDEERQRFAIKMSTVSKKFWSNLSEDEKEKFALKISKGVKTSWENLSEDEKEKRIQKSANGHKGLNYHSDEWKKELSDRLKGNKLGSLQSKETREKKRQLFLSDKNPGKNKSEETRKKLSEAAKGKIPWNKGKKRKQLTCPHCGKIGGNGLMQRWHFDNCKTKQK